MADHELELAAKFGIPEFAGFAARIEAKYKRAWSGRSNDVLTAAAEASGLEPATLGAALEADDAARDLLYRALNRAVEVDDPVYTSALGRLVGQALDPARIDEIAYLTSELERLEPVHLRILLMLFVYIADGQTVEATDAKVAAEHRAQLKFAIGEADVAEQLGLPAYAATRAIDRLQAEGLVVRGTVIVVTAKNGEPGLVPTEWAGRALLMMFPKLEEVWLGEDLYVRR